MTIKIIADSREHRSTIINLLRQREGFEVEVKELASGDYILADGFPIERKAASDFVLSIQDRRLFEQVVKMRAEYGRATFIIEGDVLATRSRMKPEAIIGAISYLTTIEDARVLTTRNVAETAELMATMARHLTQGLGYLVNHRANKPKLIRTMQEFIAEGLPCVGPVAAKALMNHFGTIPALMQADVDQLCAVPKIGMKTAKQIREVLDADYRQLG